VPALAGRKDGNGFGGGGGGSSRGGGLRVAERINCSASQQSDLSSVLRRGGRLPRQLHRRGVREPSLRGRRGRGGRRRLQLRLARHRLGGVRPVLMLLCPTPAPPRGLVVPCCSKSPLHETALTCPLTCMTRDDMPMLIPRHPAGCACAARAPYATKATSAALAPAMRARRRHSPEPLAPAVYTRDPGCKAVHLSRPLKGGRGGGVAGGAHAARLHRLRSASSAWSAGW